MRTSLVIVFLALASSVSAQDRDPRIHRVVRAIVEEHAQRQQGQDRRGGNEQTERMTRTVRIGSSGELDLSNVSGDITITRGGGNEATIDIVKTARGRTDDEAREALQLVQVDIMERSNRAEVKTRYPEGDDPRWRNRRNVNVNVSFTVTAPAGTRIRASSVSGGVSAKDIKGELTFNSVSGGIHIANGGRVAKATSVSGGVEIVDTDTDALLEVSSVSGTVTLRRMAARAIEIGSVSGGVVLEDVEASRVEAQTVSGDVRFSGPLAKGGRYELSSHSGGVSVGISGGSGFELEATSFSGSVRSDFPFNTSGSERGRRGRSLQGVYGDGSAVLELSTFSGSIVVAKR